MPYATHHHTVWASGSKAMAKENAYAAAACGPAPVIQGQEPESKKVSLLSILREMMHPTHERYHTDQL